MKTCLIVVNAYKRESAEIGGRIVSFLENRNVSAETLRFPQREHGEPGANPFRGADFAVTLGGDGTVLYAARCCAPLGIPVFPVNLGEFGFIASVQKHEWRERLAEFLDGSAACAERGMAEAVLVRGGETRCASNALNDIVVAAHTAAQMISLDIVCSGNSFGRFKADAVIVSTATGSTAYQAAAGGPIIDPALDALVLTPVCAFSLSSRPLVLPGESVLDIAVADSRTVGASLIADGRTLSDTLPGDHIVVRKSAHRVKIAGSTGAAFYAALRSKMNWAGGPVA